MLDRGFMNISSPSNKSPLRHRRRRMDRRMEMVWTWRIQSPSAVALLNLLLPIPLHYRRKFIRGTAAAPHNPPPTTNEKFLKSAAKSETQFPSALGRHRNNKGRQIVKTMHTQWWWWWIANWVGVPRAPYQVFICIILSYTHRKNMYIRYVLHFPLYQSFFFSPPTMGLEVTTVAREMIYPV